MKYQIIYADPPWSCWVGGRKNASRHYDCMAIEDIYNLPVSSLADNNCALFLWATMPMLPEAIRCFEYWGFRYSTCAFTWVKRSRSAMGWFFGCGNWTRANAELCLLGIKGSMARQAKDIPQIVDTPIMAHSRKPDEIVRDRIVALMGDLPRVELFARRKVDGWYCWGNDVESDIDLNCSFTT